MPTYMSEDCNNCFCMGMSLIYYIVLVTLICSKKMTMFTSMHFPAEMLPNTVFSSQSMQAGKNIPTLLKVSASIETEDTKEILHN